MTVNTYDIGDAVTMEGAFRDELGALTDPTAIVFTILLPDGSKITKALADLVKVAVGVYQYTYIIVDGGDHYYNFLGTGAVYAGGEGRIKVRKSHVYPTGLP